MLTTDLAPNNTSDELARTAPDGDAEQALREAWNDPDPLRAARQRDRVVVQHRSFALAQAHRFDHRGVEREDLEQVAMLGLVQAARRFRPDRGGSFVAFAAPTIIGELKRYFRDHGWGVRPPRSVQELHLEVRSATSALSQELGHPPGDEQIAERTRRTADEVREARSADEGYRTASLDAPLGGQENLALGDTISQDEPGYELAEDRVALRPLLRNLSSREQLVLKMRFVDECTQRQIGQQIGVSQMQVSRILSGVVARLRDDLYSAPQH